MEYETSREYKMNSDIQEKVGDDVNSAIQKKVEKPKVKIESKKKFNEAISNSFKKGDIVVLQISNETHDIITLVKFLVKDIEGSVKNLLLSQIQIQPNGQIGLEYLIQYQSKGVVVFALRFQHLEDEINQVKMIQVNY